VGFDLITLGWGEKGEGLNRLRKMGLPLVEAESGSWEKKGADHSSSNLYNPKGNSKVNDRRRKYFGGQRGRKTRL